ncbi:hypothetical protein [Xanthobacter oligotrophicus]|uniref:hypothetical protein n=1 Tax=Xanthobacter oligotrophicus TaxID=2607286 RepID=UPI0011F0AED6|nr:hypothetical protein [Xanthobacter oligotrophicus]MCG5235315.1 hypothetical protein [Xanthobacter oligotrophicus]
MGAELWARFVDEVAAVLGQAERELKVPATWAAFTSKRGALGVGKRSAKAGAVRPPLEDALTAELGHIARRLRASLAQGHFLRLHEVAFATEHLVESRTRTGRYSRKVDFFIYAQTGEGGPELAIEAKPLRTASDIGSRYLAAEGLGCFLTEDSPYTGHSLAGMLAYSIGPEGLSHAAALRAALGSGSAPALNLDDIQSRGSGQILLCSRHARPALSTTPITIVHLEMQFSPEPDASDGEAGQY